MMWFDMVLMVIFAMIYAGALVWALGWRHPVGNKVAGGSMLFLFLILLLTMGAARAWVPPWGPVVHGTSWLSLLLIGLVVSLLILAVSAPPEKPPRVRREAERGDPASLAAVTIFGLYFWALIVILLLAVVIGLLP